MLTLSILGGSSPFLIDLLDGLPPLGPWRLRLHGRDRAALARLAAYARHTLGPDSEVESSPDLARVLDGADIVIHQIRYGGLDGRDFDERLAAALGVAADETLGPSGLHAAIRMTPELLRVGAAMRQGCPAATVINLTNPLSCSTSLLSRAGLRVIGLCELPDATMRAACRVLDLDPERVEWCYAGLNHRGFVHALRHDGHDLLPDLLCRMGERTIGGIAAAEIAAIGAVPLKYFRLFLDPAGPRHVGRAGVVARLRDEALAALRAHPTRRPACLDRRATPWYADAVIPLLRTLRSGESAVHTVNTGDGLVREVRVEMHGSTMRPLATRPPPAPVTRWMERFETHEHALLAAALDPTTGRVRAALEADPLLRDGHAAAAAILRAIAPPPLPARALAACG